MCHFSPVGNSPSMLASFSVRFTCRLSTLLPCAMENSGNGGRACDFWVFLALMWALRASMLGGVGCMFPLGSSSGSGRCQLDEEAYAFCVLLWHQSLGVGQYHQLEQCTCFLDPPTLTQGSSGLQYQKQVVHKFSMFMWV